MKQEMNTIVKNSNFKLLANNITPSILEEFSLEKIDSNIKANTLFLYFLIQEATGIKIVNIVDYDNNTFATTLFTANNEKKTYIFEISKARTMFLTNKVQTMNQVKV